jgi:hypothetical protein
MGIFEIPIIIPIIFIVLFFLTLSIILLVFIIYDKVKKIEVILTKAKE